MKEKNFSNIPNLIPLEEALDYYLKRLPKQETELIPLEKVLGRVLAEDILANEDIPHFNRSPLDGYALLGEDTSLANSDNPIWLEILEEVPAGHLPSKELTTGFATKILTGAPLPQGTTGVIRFEDTIAQGNKVGILTALKPGSNIVLAGEDIKRGELAVKAGKPINPGGAGIIASLGYSQVETYKKPKVVILSTGDELINVDEEITPGKIRNSNLYSLTAAVIEAGGIPINFGIVGDEKEPFLAKMAAAMDAADLIVTTGGASVGDYDIIKEVFRDFGVELLFWRINIRPGTPVVGGIKEGKPIIGLSGNPGAAAITFDLLVRPIIRYLTGYLNIHRPKVKGILLDDYPKESKQRRFLRGNAHWQNGKWQVGLTGVQNPGVLKSLVASNSLIDVPAGSPPLIKGDQVEIILQGEWEGLP